MPVTYPVGSAIAEAVACPGAAFAPAGTAYTLAGALTAEGTVTGDAVLEKALTGALTAEATASGDMTVELSLSGALTAEATVTLSTGFHEDVDPFVTWLQTVMTWEGELLLDGMTLVSAPPGSPSGWTYYENFVELVDDRGMWVLMRKEIGAETPYLDFWFRHYWGNTGTSKVYWDDGEGDDTAPAAVLIDAVEFFDFDDAAHGGGYTIYPRVGHGQVMMDRARLEITGATSWTVGEVDNTVVSGEVLPWFASKQPPGFVADGAATMTNELAKMSAKADWSQWRGNDYAQSRRDRSGDQECFGYNHVAVDIWCNQGDAREGQWFKLLKKHANYVGHFIDPDGSIWDATDAAYNGLVLTSNGDFHPNSTGYSGQAWFKPALTAYPGTWMAEDPNVGERWAHIARSHLGNTFLAQVFARYRDPGIYRELLEWQEFLLCRCPAVDKGTSDYNANAMRVRGRVLQSLVSIWHITQDTRVRQRIRDTLDIHLAHVAANPFPWDGGAADQQAKRPKNSKDPGTYDSDSSLWRYAIWEAGEWAMGNAFALSMGSSELEASRYDDVVALNIDVCKWILSGWYQTVGDTPSWEIPYEVDWYGASRFYSASTTTLWAWCIGALMWVDEHYKAHLTENELNKLDQILIEKIDNAGGTANVWPELWEWVYAKQLGSSTGYTLEGALAPSSTITGDMLRDVMFYQADGSLTVDLDIVGRLSVYGEPRKQLTPLTGSAVSVVELEGTMETSQHIYYVRGDSVQIRVTSLTLDDGRTIDGTETYKWQVRQNPKGITKVAKASPTGNGIRIESETNLPTILIDPEDFAGEPDSLEPTFYVHELEMTKDGEVQTVLRGQFALETDIVHD